MLKGLGVLHTLNHFAYLCPLAPFVFLLAHVAMMLAAKYMGDTSICKFMCSTTGSNQNLPNQTTSHKHKVFVNALLHNSI